MKRNFKLIVFVVVTIMVLPLDNIYAASGSPEIYFKTTSESFAPGSEFTVGVFINSEKPVNAFRLEIGFSPQTLEFLNYNTNFSIIEFWRQDPEILSDGIIKIEGGLAKTFSGRAGEIIKLNFKAKTEGSAQWSFRQAEIYYADGFGTLAEVKSTPLIFPILKESVLVSLPDDKISPVILNLEIAKSPVDDSRLAVFNAVDKESGLKTTYLRFRKWLFWSDWEKATNPVRLTAGIWSFQLKAVDNEGNASLRTVYLNDEIFQKVLYLILIFVAVIIFYYFFQLRRKRKML